MTDDERDHKQLLQAYAGCLYPNNEDKLLDATDRLYDILEPKLRAFIFGKLDHFDAADVLQVTMIAIFRDLYKFRGGNPKLFGRIFLSWCYRIARNKINDHLRKYMRREFLPLEDLEKHLKEYHELVESSSDVRLECEEALLILAKTKPHCRDYLWNRYMVGMEPLQMANLYRVELDAMRRRIERCLKPLKEILLKLYE